MIITFCGHSEMVKDDTLYSKVLSLIRRIAMDRDVTFYLGGYGDFDSLAFRACREYKEGRPSARLVFVTPYLDESYLKNREEVLKRYDEVLYPEIETTPPHYAILKRNEWMVRHADFLIACVDCGFGGAAKTLECAIKAQVPYVNLGKRRFDK